MRSLQNRDRLQAFERFADIPMLIMSMVFVLVVTLPWFWPSADKYEPLLESAEWIIWGVFAAELSIRLFLSPKRLRFLAANWFDVVIVVVPFLRPLRLLRGLRVLALLVRTASTGRRILSRRGLQYVLLFALGTIVMSAIAVLQAERGSGQSPIQDLGDALWWSVTTVTTVGYGDTYPTTPAGRGIGVALMLIGIALFGVITANVAAFFVQEDGSDDLAEVRSALERIEARLSADPTDL